MNVPWGASRGRLAIFCKVLYRPVQPAFNVFSCRMLHQMAKALSLLWPPELHLSHEATSLVSVPHSVTCTAMQCASSGTLFASRLESQCSDPPSPVCGLTSFKCSRVLRLGDNVLAARCGCTQLFANAGPGFKLGPRPRFSVFRPLTHRLAQPSSTARSMRKTDAFACRTLPHAAGARPSAEASDQHTPPSPPPHYYLLF